MLPYVFGQMVLPAPDDDREKVHTIFQPAQGEQTIPSQGSLKLSESGSTIGCPCGWNLCGLESAVFHLDGDSGGGRHKTAFDRAGFSVSPISAER